MFTYADIFYPNNLHTLEHWVPQDILELTSNCSTY